MGRQVLWYIEAGYGDEDAFAEFSSRAMTLALDKDFTFMDSSPPFPQLDDSGPRILTKGVPR